MKEVLCYGCMGKHKLKDYPKKSKIMASMVINPMQVLEESKEDLLVELRQGQPKRTLAISGTKKVPSIPHAVLSLGTK